MPEIQVKVNTIFHTTLERAFKTPMLCDITQVHTGYGFMPAVTHCTEDGSWGQPGSTKKVHVAKSLTQTGGFASIDKVLVREENRSWKIEVSDFQAWMLGFDKFVGEWATTEVASGQVRIDYTYTLHAGQPWLYPLQWMFARLFWKTYMGRVLENIRRMVDRQEPYQYP